jgi:hypothetical protein
MFSTFTLHISITKKPLNYTAKSVMLAFLLCAYFALCFLCEKMSCDFTSISLNQHIIFVFGFSELVFENFKNVVDLHFV